MIKFKKTISIISLAVVLVLSSLLFIACSGRVNAKDCFTLFETTITSYKEKTDVFKADSIVNGVRTDFYLDNLKFKDKDGTFLSTDKNYHTFVAYGLNYIENNYQKLKDLDVEHNFASINRQVNEMNKAFEEVEREFANLKLLDDSVKYQIYNGHATRCKQAVKNFITEVFDSAIALGEYLIEENGDGIGTSDATGDTFNAFLDYHKLLICKDFEEFLIESAEGQIFDEDLFDKVQTNFKTYCNTVLKKSELSLSTEEAESVKKVVEVVNADRKNVMMSLKEFSINDFYTAYEGSLDAYEKTNEYASVYYNNIMSYFYTNGTMATYCAYLNSL